jgi:hypothetical protein
MSIAYIHTYVLNPEFSAADGGQLACSKCCRSVLSGKPVLPICSSCVLIFSKNRSISGIARHCQTC